MKTKPGEQPITHTPEQEKRIREMLTPALDIVEQEYGSWGLDCVRDLCCGRMEDIHRT